MGEVTLEQSLWTGEILVHGVINSKETVEIIGRRTSLSKSKGITVYYCEFI